MDALLEKLNRLEARQEILEKIVSKKIERKQCIS